MFVPKPSMDYNYIAFGEVTGSFNALDAIESYGTDSGFDHPEIIKIEYAEVFNVDFDSLNCDC